MAANKPLVLIRRAAAPALGVIIIAYFLGAAVMGDNGVMSWGEYRKAKTERQAQLDQLKAEEGRLANRARLLDPRQTDPDLAEEMTRRELGVVRSDEVVVPLE
ncbi:MAG TPA: septum formation initiator family protein [Allosphingosinicella sp.]|jgi:cell division protein FtsB